MSHTTISIDNVGDSVIPHGHSCTKLNYGEMNNADD